MIPNRFTCFLAKELKIASLGWDAKSDLRARRRMSQLYYYNNKSQANVKATVDVAQINNDLFKSFSVSKVYLGDKKMMLARILPEGKTFEIDISAENLFCLLKECGAHSGTSPVIYGEFIFIVKDNHLWLAETNSKMFLDFKADLDLKGGRNYFTMSRLKPGFVYASSGRIFHLYLGNLYHVEKKWNKPPEKIVKGHAFLEVYTEWGKPPFTQSEFKNFVSKNYDTASLCFYSSSKNLIKEEFFAFTEAELDDILISRKKIEIANGLKRKGQSGNYWNGYKTVDHEWVDEFIQKISFSRSLPLKLPSSIKNDFDKNSFVKKISENVEFSNEVTL